MSNRIITKSREEDYNYENIAKIMGEEEGGIHISLLDTGDVRKGVPIYGISIETDLGVDIVVNIMKGLLRQAEGGRDIDS